MQSKVLTINEILKNIQSKQKDYFQNYLAMYSTWFGGIVTDPALMLVPIDDHMVHRGDGVFEAIKVTNTGIYLLDEHLERLSQSAEKIGLYPSLNKSKMRQIIIQTVNAAQVSEGIIRLFLGRGPGSFSPNPYDPKQSQFYVVVTKPGKPSAQKYEEGVSLCRSLIPMKSGFFPQVKSLNYLPNVLMKKEAIDRGYDFSVGMDPEKNLLEGATENLIILSKNNTLIHPPLQKILRGTMMERLFQLVEASKTLKPKLKVKRGYKISEKDLISAQGVFLIGTSLDIIAVSKYEKHSLKISPLAKKFLELLLQDQQINSKKMTLLN